MHFTRHILVPTDFSEASGPALEAARVLALQNDAKITLAHVCDTRPPFTGGAEPGSDGGSEYETELREGIIAELKRIGEQELSDVPQARVAVVMSSNAADGICQFARNEEVDLIVLATHGRTGLFRFLIGSVAEKVVRHAPCRVLTLRSRPAEERKPE